MARLFEALDAVSAGALLGAAGAVLLVLVLTERLVIQRGRA